MSTMERVQDHALSPPASADAVPVVAPRRTSRVLSALIDVVGWDEALGRIADWARRNESRYICICNVHSVVTAQDNRAFLEVVNGADMATPDGAPIAWSLRASGHQGQERINGPDLMWKQLEQAEALGLVVSFYGSSQATLDLLRMRMLAEFPGLKVGVMISPPYGETSKEVAQGHIDAIHAAGTQILYVGLGCPKQEFWMARHRGRVQAVMLGVGAAFDYHAGTVKRAPLWMQAAGLEWLHRLATEPRRLWRRYLSTNSRFIWLMACQRLLGRTMASLT